VFVAGSLAWGMVVDTFRPDRWDITGALICVVGVAVIKYGLRAAGCGLRAAGCGRLLSS